MKKLLIVLFFFTYCKGGGVQLSSEQKGLITNIFEENQKVHELLINSEDKLPDLSNLTDSFKKAKSSISEGPISSLLTEGISALEKVKSDEKNSVFSVLSQSSEKLSEVAKLAEIKEYNKFYCPMVEKYWIAKGEKIENPYASDMRECGEMIR